MNRAQLVAVLRALGVTADEVRAAADELAGEATIRRAAPTMRTRPDVVSAQDRVDAARVLARAGAKPRR